ncbi:MAG: hypothetical protein HY331_16065 [Chloroflexi bacterium]|nr:hypothetical protein [Chloroflexota bacterium]
MIGGALLAGAIAVAGLNLMGGSTGQGDDAISVLRTDDFHALAFHPADPNVVFFGHHNGLMRSDDGGKSWRALVQRRNFDAMGLAISSTHPQQIYLAGHDVFQWSSDGGASWKPVAHNLSGTDIHGFAASPDDPNRLYAFVNGVGAFQSADTGMAWQRLGGQLPGDVMALAAAGGNPETLYAASMRSGVLRSADGGRSWSPATNGLDARPVLTLAVDPSARQTVYAGADGGLFKSTDGGSTWQRLPFPGDNAIAVAVSPARPSVLLAIAVKARSAADREGRVYRSEDGGLTWGGR